MIADEQAIIQLWPDRVGTETTRSKPVSDRGRGDSCQTPHQADPFDQSIMKHITSTITPLELEGPQGLTDRRLTPFLGPLQEQVL